MVDVRPFSGLRFNAAQGLQAQDVTAPPYDVISPEAQQALHEKSPYNIVRLILGQKSPSDSETENVYTRAHQTLEAWRKENALAAESQPAFYAYSQEWDGNVRRGFIGLLRVESYESGKILPHEFTLGGPKADRLNLFKATGSILSPIFCLYHDPGHSMEHGLFDHPSTVDVIDVTDADGVRHQFWPVTERAEVSRLELLMNDKSVLIADGHHRYETAVAYSQWRREQDGQQEAPHGSLPWDFTMAYFCNMADSGLKIYPTHRVFTALPTGWTSESLQAALLKAFEVTPDEQEPLFWVETSGKPAVGYSLKSGVDLSVIAQPLRELDVAILDELVFKGMLGQTANDLKQQGLLHFVREEAEVVEALQTPETVVFRVHAPDVDAVRRICESGERMPQKSTYFYPKLLSGLVLYYYGPQSLAGVRQS